MKLLYIGCFCEPSQMPFINKHTKGHITISTTTFQRAFLAGFESEKLKPDYIINVPDLGSFPLRCDTPFFKPSDFTYYSMNGKNCSFMNLTIFKHYSIYKSIKKEASKWMEVNRGEDKLIIVYSLISSYLEAAIELKRAYPRTKVCCIVLDLPEYFGDNTSLLHRLWGQRCSLKVYTLVPEIDMFVLLTKDMAGRLKLGNRPWMLMEGIYNPVDVKEQKKVPKSILYTGKLDARFGIQELVEAFRLIKDPEFSLWICGDGIERQYVEQASLVDRRIKYKGLLDQGEVFELQRSASLLINPRRGNEEYTKYSFPSKTMEYMASGTPTIMYALPGIPEDYLPYLIIIPDDTIETMRDVLWKYGNKSQVELERIGHKARQFILQEKTSNKQIRRLVEFIITNSADFGTM